MMAYGAVAQMGERYTDKVEAVVRIYEVPQRKEILKWKSK